MHPTYIGCDFGNKGNSRLTPICYYLAKASRRPLRMISDYTEEFLAGNPRHHVVLQLKTGVKRDGTLTAHTVNHVVNSGAYAAFKSYGTIAGANEAAGPYRVANSRIDSVFVYTNTVPGGFMRAPGEPEGVFAVESHMDEVARRIGMDPVEFRLKNLIVEGDETAFGHLLHDVRARETLQAAVDAAGYGADKPPNVGRGVAVGERGTGAGGAPSRSCSNQTAAPSSARRCSTRAPGRTRPLHRWPAKNLASRPSASSSRSGTPTSWSQIRA